jgi:hypothetical protein
MLLLKACPHCHGDLVFEQDRACGYFTCVQCGHILSTDEERALGYRVTALGPLHACAESHRTRRLPRTRGFHDTSARVALGAARHRKPRDACLISSPERAHMLSRSERLTRQ